MQRLLTTPLALMLMATAAQATPFASGKLYGGPTQNQVACYILNTSTKSVTLSTVRITGEVDGAVSVDTTCGTTLGAHMGCFTQTNAPIFVNVGYDCSTDASLATGLRGSIEIRSNYTTLQVQPLR